MKKMKKLQKEIARTIALAVIMFFLSVNTSSAQMMHGFNWDKNYRSPGLAAALSLQPMPLDLGNFYVDNWRRAILYSTLETVLFIPAMILVSDHSDWNHGWNNNEIDESSDWTSSEKETFYGLIGGYVLIKLVSAFDAGNQAEKFNRRVRLSFKTYNKIPGMELAFYFRKKPKNRI